MEILDASGLEKIGEGRYREVYCDGNLCFKFPKKYLLKRYCGYELKYPLQRYSQYKFGIRDINVYELEIFRHVTSTLDSPLLKQIVSLSDIQETTRGQALVGELIMNSDGSVARSLRSYKGATNRKFWETLREICFSLENKGFSYFGLSDENVVVRETSEGVEPVVVDLKRIGRRMLPFQPLLLFRGVRQSKIQRALERLYEEYGRVISS